MKARLRLLRRARAVAPLRAAAPGRAAVVLSLAVCGAVTVPTAAQEPQRGVTVEERPRADYDPPGIPAGAFLVFPSLRVVVSQII